MAALVISALSVAAHAGPAAGTKPNIVWVMSDGAFSHLQLLKLDGAALLGSAALKALLAVSLEPRR